MGTVAGDEVVFVSGHGCELEDRDGRLYIDACAGLGYCNVGYGRPEIATVVADQIVRLSGCTHFDRYASDRALALSERLACLAPLDDPVVFLCSGGSDAIDTAAKLARRFWAEQGMTGKTTILSRVGTFHGCHAFGTSIGGIDANAEHMGPLVREVRAIAPHDPGALEAAIREIGAANVAAFIAEPVISAGVHPPGPGYWPTVQRICQEHDVLLVLDEVWSGFGRLGSWFAASRFGIEADMIAFAKGVTSGYFPLGGVVASTRVAEPFWGRDTSTVFRHGYTYSGHPVGCAAAEENLDIIEREELCERVVSFESTFAHILEDLEELPNIAEVRAVGLAAGVQITKDMLEADPGFAHRVVRRCLERGVLTRLLNNFAFQVTPPLVVDEERLVRIRDAIAYACA
jgi:adenosylmethionine-8-amino-7-oxononanoate aminotransferase